MRDGQNIMWVSAPEREMPSLPQLCEIRMPKASEPQ
jgi:hypothetical protein